jgi:predicted nucleic acid-binding protein
MRILVDTGVLLRVLHRDDPQYLSIRDAIRKLNLRGDTLVTSLQNIGEFWNVCTRPSSARGGYGLSLAVARKRLQLIEELFPLLIDTEGSYFYWKKLVFAYNIQGVQSHDARLVALMQSHAVNTILTFNVTDFECYEGIIALLPQSIR